jgi:hypothetical protein
MEVFLWFSFTRLLDLGVDALDLVENPGNYGFEEEEAMLSVIAQGGLLPSRY